MSHMVDVSKAEERVKLAQDEFNKVVRKYDTWEQKQKEKWRSNFDLKEFENDEFTLKLKAEIQACREAFTKANDVLVRAMDQSNISVVSKKRPATPDMDIAKHIESLQNMMWRTKDYSVVTPIGDSLEIYPVLADKEPTTVTVKFVGDSDFMILESTVQICDVNFEMRPVRTGTEYVQIGLSGLGKSIMHRRGHIANDSVPNNAGFYLGSAECSKGDSGAGVFSVNSFTLYGICCATFKAFGKADFRAIQVQHVGDHLNRLASHSAEPVLSCITPSIYFCKLGEIPCGDDTIYPDQCSDICFIEY